MSLPGASWIRTNIGFVGLGIWVAASNPANPPHCASQTGEAGLSAFTVMDHYFQMEAMASVDEPMLEGYTTLGYLAAKTDRMTLELLVTGVVNSSMECANVLFRAGSGVGQDRCGWWPATRTRAMCSALRSSERVETSARLRHRCRRLAPLRESSRGGTTARSGLV